MKKTREIAAHRGLKAALVVGLLLLVCGCMVSEQIGEPVGHGNSRMPGKDVAIHFDTQFNRIVLFGRSGLLLGLALWIFRAFGKSAISLLVVLGVTATAGWLFVKDFPRLTGYRVEVSEGGLYLKVPPDLDTEIPWSAIQELELAGFAYGSARARNMPGPSTALELPAWETMDLTLNDGTKHRIRLGELSVEHRAIFARALIRRAGLVQVE